jgi:hypothetical protein
MKQLETALADGMPATDAPTASAASASVRDPAALAAEGTAPGKTFEMVALLNVLDRCSKPRTLLADLRDRVAPALADGHIGPGLGATEAREGEIAGVTPEHVLLAESLVQLKAHARRCAARESACMHGVFNGLR